MKQYLSILIKPEKVKVRIDGGKNIPCNGNFTQLLEVGEHEVEISADHYESKVFKTTVVEDNSTKMEICLSPLFGTIELLSKPSEAEVWINGSKTGVTPFKSGMLESGNYNIELRKEEYRTLTKNLTIINGDEIKLDNLKLEELPGILYANITPYGSKVFLGGKEVGLSPLRITNIKLGYYDIKCVDTEGHELNDRIYIKGGATTTYNNEIAQSLLKDYSQCRIGDYFYSDGRFSHARCNDKEPAGIIFSLTTTPEEKSRGWTHGQIVALRDYKDRLNWITVDAQAKGYDECKQCTSCTMPILDSKDKRLHDKDGYILTMRGQVEQPESYPVFNACKNFQPAKRIFEKRSKVDNNAQLPQGITSGWYLPSIGQWIDIFMNLGKLELKHYLWGFFTVSGVKRVKRLLGLSSHLYWTSMTIKCKNGWICDRNNWVCDIGNFGVEFNPTDHKSYCYIRPVAAF